MQFQTIIDIKPFDRRIDHTQPILSLGSCFANNIAQRLQRAKFQITASPTGVLFNPESIAAAIERFADVANNELCLPQMEELQNEGDIWFNYDFHSSFSRSNADEALTVMRNAIKRGAEALAKAEVVIITFGTAFAYRLCESGQIVANCHKQPQAKFSREMLTTATIVERYRSLLQGSLSGKQVIFTLSPVRHLGDGLEQNSLSKATLRVALAEIVAQADNAYYFPSFEIMMDELRDYRFYGDDMAHPTTMAVDYIWERFGHTAFSDNTLKLITNIERIVAATEHRPFNAKSDAHRHFCKNMLHRIEELNATGICFDKEKEYFRSYL